MRWKMKERREETQKVRTSLEGRTRCSDEEVQGERVGGRNERRREERKRWMELA